MITVRAPVRISFGGGGTDLAAYADRFGGYVISAAISRYSNVTICPPMRPGAFTIASADYKQRASFAPGQPLTGAGPLSLPRAALALFAERRPDLLAMGGDLSLSSEAPPGAGLGSSSAMAVALAQALALYLGESLSQAEVAALACQIEIERLAMPIGKQDQYASAFGGLNTISFSSRDTHVEPLALSPVARRALNARLLLFFTGKTRHSTQILGQQQRATQDDPAVVASLHRIKELAHAMRTALLAARFDDFGALLDAGWREKKTLSSAISTSEIDEWYAQARAAGALGGKIAGAGGGGFLLLYCPPQRQAGLRKTMARLGLSEFHFGFAEAGVTTLAPLTIVTDQAAVFRAIRAMKPTRPLRAPNGDTPAQQERTTTYA